jgi:DNA-binding CsgD family transcriptional regulator
MESSEALVAWHALCAEPRLICDRAGDIIWSNAAARDFAKRTLKSDVANKDPVDLWRETMDSGLFLRILATAVTCPVGKARSVTLDGGTLSRHIIVKVIPLAGDSEAPIGITVPQDQRLSAERCADIQSIYGLSGAELRVLAYLIEGKTLFEAADGTETSIYTARTHLRNIYQKLRVSNREAMFHVLSPLL